MQENGSKKARAAPRRKYDADFKAEILRMVASGQTVAYVSQALGVSENLIYRWKQKTQGKEEAAFQHDSTSLSVENQQFKERVRQLEVEREILKKSPDHFQPTELRQRYEFIRSVADQFCVSTLCEMLKVSPTAYYRYLRGGSYQVTAAKEAQSGAVG